MTRTAVRAKPACASGSAARSADPGAGCPRTRAALTKTSRIASSQSTATGPTPLVRRRTRRTRRTARHGARPEAGGIETKECAIESHSCPVSIATVDILSTHQGSSRRSRPEPAYTPFFAFMDEGEAHDGDRDGYARGTHTGTHERACRGRETCIDLDGGAAATAGEFRSPDRARRAGDGRRRWSVCGFRARSGMRSRSSRCSRPSTGSGTTRRHRRPRPQRPAPALRFLSRSTSSTSSTRRFCSAGLALSGLVSPWIAWALLVSYLLLCAESLATHTLGVFRISFAGFGPTELRICSR